MTYELSAELREQARKLGESAPPLSPRQCAVIATVMRPVLKQVLTDAARTSAVRRKKAAA